MKMTIGKRVINARIEKREEARKQYEQAKNQGKSASLLEQQRPNVFQMNVANIMPGDEIKVELRYNELLVPTDRVYEFIYPTVVGPRYSNQAADTAPPSERWVQNPYLRQGEAPGYTFDIRTTIAAGLPIRELACTSQNHRELRRAFQCQHRTRQIGGVWRQPRLHPALPPRWGPHSIRVAALPGGKGELLSYDDAASQESDQD
jgi:hypothetical protein